jgi:hypothetical protein
MMSGRKEIAIGLAFVAIYVFLFRFIRSSRMVVQDLIGLIVAMLPIILNVEGWRRWRGTRRDEKAVRWRKIVGFVGLVANTSAVCFFYIIVVMDLRYKNGYKLIDTYPVIVGCLILAAVTLAIGLFALRRIRLAVVLGSFATSWVILLALGSGGVL